jgi:5-methylcytosine-specific restriction endonuclease McrA
MESKIKLICEQCGKEFSVIPSRLKWGRGKHCSRKCQYLSNKVKLSKPEAKESKTCIGCGKIFITRKCWLTSKKGGGKYCSRSCRDKFRIKTNHPQYLNGTSSERRGPNWHSQKRKALKRDRCICQQCDKVATDVHHILPFRFFGITYYLIANNLSNLVSLCKRCHRKSDSFMQQKWMKGFINKVVKSFIMFVQEETNE